MDQQELSRLLEAKWNAINKSLDAHEKLQKIVVIKDAWTPDNDLLTPTFKLKRNEIERRYKDMMDTWYQHHDPIVFAT